MITVTMIDTFMSDWGPCKGRDNVFMVHCLDHAQAEQVADRARERDEMRKVRIHDTDAVPEYDAARFLVSEKNFSDLGGCWLEGWEE